MDDLTLPGMPADPEQPAALDPDPQPGKPARRGPGRPRKDGTAPAAAKRTSTRSSTPRSSARAVSKAASVAEIRAEIELYLMMAAGAGSLQCAPCGAVAEEQVPKLADKLAAMIARSPALMAKFSTGTLLADVFGLVMAALPIVRAVYSHHGPGSRHEHAEGVSDVDPFSRYGAYTPAGAMG